MLLLGFHCHQSTTSERKSFVLEHRCHTTTKDNYCSVCLCSKQRRRHRLAVVVSTRSAMVVVVVVVSIATSAANSGIVGRCRGSCCIIVDSVTCSSICGLGGSKGNRRLSRAKMYPTVCEMHLVSLILFVRYYRNERNKNCYCYEGLFSCQPNSSPPFLSPARYVLLPPVILNVWRTWPVFRPVMVVQMRLIVKSNVVISLPMTLWTSSMRVRFPR